MGTEKSRRDLHTLLDRTRRIGKPDLRGYGRKDTVDKVSSDLTIAVLKYT